MALPTSVADQEVEDRDLERIEIDEDLGDVAGPAVAGIRVACRSSSQQLIQSGGESTGAK
jgi:hypothetical protein